MDIDGELPVFSVYLLVPVFSISFHQIFFRKNTSIFVFRENIESRIQKIWKRLQRAVGGFERRSEWLLNSIALGVDYYLSPFIKYFWNIIFNKIQAHGTLCGFAPKISSGALPGSLSLVFIRSCNGGVDFSKRWERSGLKLGLNHHEKLARNNDQKRSRDKNSHGSGLRFRCFWIEFALSSTRNLVPVYNFIDWQTKLKSPFTQLTKSSSNSISLHEWHQLCRNNEEHTMKQVKSNLKDAHLLPMSISSPFSHSRFADLVFEFNFARKAHIGLFGGCFGTEFTLEKV